MTTLKDYLYDLARDVQLDLINLNEDKDIATLNDEELNDKVDEYIELIKNRIVG